MAFQQIRGRCRVSVKDIRFYKSYDYGIRISIDNVVFFEKYKSKAIKGNDLLILQGTREIEPDYTGRFTIEKCNIGDLYTQIKIKKFIPKNGGI
ncbi:hypothetical protein KNP65_03810 [Latilactobacillus curvatus]|uniref:hypothetical protein n=1 Tax=Latilactobacillus curvatus TaxID=28038 RepID=UPI002410FF30|nr:hypothetical protein [Latilactobacillus curvatus]MDG2979064.1 hypothetical protein [Latilactobacillus curvatus]